MQYFFLILGFAILIIGGEFLVRGAVGIAKHLKISPLVVGLTIVSIGTSAPELLVSFTAAMKGYADISIGNVVGSNIVNITLILGITALIFPGPINKKIIKLDWPFMFGATLLLWLFAFLGIINRWEGLIMIVSIILYFYTIIKNSRKLNLASAPETKQDKEKKLPGIWINVILILLGALGLDFGSDWLINSAAEVAKILGVSQRIISVTLIAFGTSIPELTASIISAYKGHDDIAIGNLMGSNIANILLILGITALARPLHINPETLHIDIYFMLISAVALLLTLSFGKKITRIEAAILVLIYFSYLYIIL